MDILQKMFARQNKAIEIFKKKVGKFIELPGDDEYTILIKPGNDITVSYVDHGWVIWEETISEAELNL